VYSPQAEVWTQKAVWGIERRVMPYGRLPKVLVANGYDFDPVNDDVLQHHALFEKGLAHIRGHAYRFLILQRIRVIPAATLRAILRFAEAGGVIIALEELPSLDPGMKGDDAEVRRLVQQIFENRQNAHFIPDFRFQDVPFTSQEMPYEETPPLDAGSRKLLNTLRRYVAPDFALEGGRQSNGLTFLHRRVDSADIYFVTNLQPVRAAETVTFRTHLRAGERWDPMTGSIDAVKVLDDPSGGAKVRVDLEPWESMFYVFYPGTAAPVPEPPAAPPLAPVEIIGPWKLSLEGVRFPRVDRQLTRLAFWTEAADLLHCSGTGAYEAEFDLPPEFLKAGAAVMLDLGRVAFVADVAVNGEPVGVRFMQPYRLDIRKAARPGRNRLTVKVTNLLINHVAGLKDAPPIPEQLRAHYGDKEKYAPGLAVFLNRDRRFKPLPPGGLAGPVRVYLRPGNR
jgi:hypothetical protein